MTEQSNLSTQRVNISTQKMLGGIGSILIAIGVPGWVPVIGNLNIVGIVGLVGLVLWLISLYQLSNMLKKSDIFRKILIGFILQIVGSLMAAVFGGAVVGILGPEILRAASSSPGGYGIETKLVFEFILLIIGFIVAYPFNVIASYFYKRAYEILALATAKNLFKTAGLLVFIGAITAILFGLGLLLIAVGYIVLAVAFFTTPNEVEVQGA